MGAISLSLVFPPLPLGHGLVRDPQPVRQLLLGHALLLPKPGDQSAHLVGIQVCSLLCGIIIANDGAARKEYPVESPRPVVYPGLFKSKKDLPAQGRSFWCF